MKRAHKAGACAGRITGLFLGANRAEIRGFPVQSGLFFSARRPGEHGRSGPMIVVERRVWRPIVLSLNAYARPCSIAKRVAAARELTSILR
jgi:hypothetical protein